MGKMKKKYESGAATAYIARNQAIKKLQLTIADFRRLCILKGVYPVEPKNKKKVNKGSTANRTFYYAKDISYIAQEPIINKFRDFKVYVKRLRRAKGKRDRKRMRDLRTNKPFYKIDHIVKERYPSFLDAVRDLDDCLSLVFMFAMLPKSKRVFVEVVHLCRRLSLEFLHHVIISQSLRKCFISIKGYYFQAEIAGQKITWIMPHKLAYHPPNDVDFRIMSTFVEFYTVMLGFVNFKFYQDSGLYYPPKLALPSSEVKDKNNLDDFNDEFLASLNCDFVKLRESNTETEVPLDEFPVAQDIENPDEMDQAKIDEDNLKKFKNLFKGFKFFLNREIPREHFAFVIRCFNGEVSWDKSVAAGATYQEDDLTITHQIVDRPLAGKTSLNRVYVQPQWIFDCVNEGILLPVKDYLPGAALPPHLSPFVDINAGDYVPPEKQRLLNLKSGEIEPVDQNVEDDEDNDEEEEIGSDHESDVESEEEPEQKPKVVVQKQESDKQTKVMSVTRSKLQAENLEKKVQKEKDEEKRLTEMMIPKKHKRLYSKIMYSQKKKRQEAEKLTEKRKAYDDQQKKATKKKTKKT